MMQTRALRSASRRRFLKVAASAAVLCAAPESGRAYGRFGRDESTSKPSQAVRNRAPLTANAFDLLPLGTIRPSGWLKDQLRIQADGLSGHLDEIWPDVGPNSGWLGGTGESFERGPYYLDGLVPLAYLLEDATLKAKAQKFIDWALSSQQPSGAFGPHASGAKGNKGRFDWWPPMVMLKALSQYQEATRDPRVIPFMQRYYDYQLRSLPSNPLVSWAKFRWQDNAMSVLWLYNRRADPKLLDLVRLLHSQGHDWQAQFANFKITQSVTRAMIKADPDKTLGMSSHGVNNGQALKASPVWYTLTGKQEVRDALKHQLAEIDRYHGLPNGMFSCDEHFAGKNPSQGSELCTVVETMFSLEQSLAILGDASLGDRLEKIAFNALPGTLTDDMWAHQYNQESNQVECGHITPWLTDGPESNLYGLAPNFGCCTANYHQGWPKFVSSLWMASADGGLLAAVYSPCEIATMIASTQVQISVATQYPFRDSIRITVDPKQPVSFPLHLRIPEWAEGAKVMVNGKTQSAVTPGSFSRIEREWKVNDVVMLKLPMRPVLTRWFNQSIAVSRGPLVFSFPIETKWEKLRSHGPMADWEVYPKSDWNYGLAVTEETVGSLHVAEAPVGSRPFAQEGTSVRISVPARKVPTWKATDGVADPVPQSFVQSEEREELISLIPYAAAKLRITAFPQLATATNQI